MLKLNRLNIYTALDGYFPNALFVFYDLFNHLLY